MSHFHEIIIFIRLPKKGFRVMGRRISPDGKISYLIEWEGCNFFWIPDFLSLWVIKHDSWRPKYGLRMYLFLLQQLSKTKNILALFFKFKSSLKTTPPRSTTTNHWHATIFMSHKLWIIAKLVRQPFQPISVNSK